ncbi:MAG TPA: BTAD domain-containing putative transcriptional regulator [Conexibacter sp.]|nr:BTAD domain-containing putative transcriptional regulator [Conexibacter sp.]
MVTTIRLLGVPAIVRDGVPAPPPRGRKAWALLTYLLLSERPASRRQLAELLFAGAADPLGALRWNLAQLRRALGPAAALQGDPVELVLAAGVVVDVRETDPAEGVLLEGRELAASPAFESWLLVARRRYVGRAEARLRETALAELAAGRPDRAVELAARLVALDPFDEGHHELLIRGLASGGDRAGALAQVAACRRLFRQELGCEPSPAVRRAAAPAPGLHGEAVAVGGRGAARGHLEAGEAAVAAGALEHGLSCLRQARAVAAACGDDALHACALVALGTALVHAVRGRDEEGAAVLHEALAVAEAAGHRETLVAALRELAYTDVQAGRRAAVERRLARAAELAGSDAEHAAILAVQGMNRSDMGDYAGAFTALRGAVDRAERCGDRRQAAFSLTLIGRAQLLRGEASEAIGELDRALALVEAERWLAFLPLPEALRREVDLAACDTARASERFERAFALACELRDPCWEGLAARNLGLLHRARGQMGSARGWVDEARARCTRLPDRYVWMQGHVLDTAILLSLDEAEHEQRHDLIRALGALAARAEMRELVIRGLVHAARIGQAGALDSARMLVGEIDNPVLTALVGDSQPHTPVHTASADDATNGTA